MKGVNLEIGDFEKAVEARDQAEWDWNEAWALLKAEVGKASRLIEMGKGVIWNDIRN